MRGAAGTCSSSRITRPRRGACLSWSRTGGPTSAGIISRPASAGVEPEDSLRLLRFALASRACLPGQGSSAEAFPRSFCSGCPWLLARYYLHWSDNLVFVMREAATVELRLLIDHSVIEAFAQGGRHVGTTTFCPPSEADDGIVITNRGLTDVQVTMVLRRVKSANVMPTSQNRLTVIKGIAAMKREIARSQQRRKRSSTN
mmetsp:Transcript_10964/g.25258  ORF Transcript_10964/g.25258 Transcript_10964/m.25258 type:complete len:201 (+) Transcript_10964:2138-2740(+)